MTEVESVEVRRFLEQVEPLRNEAHALLEGLSPKQANWRATPDQWSIAQCIDHITLTLRLYPERVRDAIEESRTRVAAGARPYREGWFSRWFVRSMEPPPRMRVRTRRSVEPPVDLDGAAVLAAFDDELTKFSDLVAAADGVSLIHGRVQSPFLKLLRFTLGQTFAINLGHARRHLWQARQVRAAPGYPGTGVG